MSELKKIDVILCTYNGEKYIAEQIDSILEQSYRNLELHIRDDHSTDNTLEILQRYSSDPRVKLYFSSNNLGYPFSFYDLLSKVSNADYYSFSDQDDVWYNDKLERAIQLLDGSDPEKPAIVYANYDVCDEELNILRTSQGPGREPDFLYSLYASLGLGFTYVLNSKARELILKYRSVKNITKDVWIGMCCTAFGKAFFDPKPCALHRRNSGSFSSQDRNFLQIQKERFNKFIRGNGLSSVHSVMEEFYEIFGSELSEPDRYALELFLRRDFSARFMKCFYPKRLRYSLSDEISLRLIFILGLI